MKAIKFSNTIRINERAERVFDYTQDYENRLVWDSFLTRAELINGALKADKGVKAYCVAKNNMGMETEYVTFNRPKVTAVKMTKGPYMFKQFAASWAFKEIEEQQTEVVFTYTFQLRFPFNIVPFLVKRNLQNNVQQRMEALKCHLED